ncbi:MAG: hypothetical protein HKN47_06630 [Pirellulaceae bacterium]|nr:hypothetical protein [Pirellulaceae bacterium]
MSETAEHGVTLSILASRFDVAYLPLTVAHLVTACDYPFAQRMLVIDVSPPPPERAAETGAATLAELKLCAQQLCDDGWIDRVIEFDIGYGHDRRLQHKHGGQDFVQTRDTRGVPLWPWICEFESCQTEYLVHFDCDMLLFQRRGHSWIRDAISLVQQRDEVLFVLPLPGPPTKDGTLFQSAEFELVDESASENVPGYYRFKTFTSRKFLLQRSRLAKLLPLEPAYDPPRSNRSVDAADDPVRSWETMVSQKLQSSRFIRADLSSPDAWTLHAKTHSAEFVNELPRIIARVQSGQFPADQAGHYDLKLRHWSESPSAT